MKKINLLLNTTFFSLIISLISIFINKVKKKKKNFYKENEMINSVSKNRIEELK